MKTVMTMVCLKLVQNEAKTCFLLHFSCHTLLFNSATFNLNSYPCAADEGMDEDMYKKLLAQGGGDDDDDEDDGKLTNLVSECA